MRRTTRVRTRIRHQSAVGVSLFPFLAVLICTMGALILLLVIIARQARLQAAEDTALKNAGLQKDLRSAREWAQLEVSEYQYSRQKTEAQLTETRMALGHVEDHARRLRDQVARLEATWRELESLQTNGTGRREELKAEIETLRARIAQSERELAEAQEAQGRDQSYAVVPYEGPNATHRRPIYIECRHDAVVLQPEGIVLDDDDFVAPLGSGNPLDVALRAIREYLIRQENLDPQNDGEPYPLLLVRPSGIGAYYATREAMKSWASDFGYELIGEDWKLEFQAIDPKLAEEVKLAVETARVRQRQLIAAAPGRYARGLGGEYVAAPYRGGFVQQSGFGDGRADFQPATSVGRFGNQFGPGGAGEDQGSDAHGPAAPATRQPGDVSPQTDLPPLTPHPSPITNHQTQAESGSGRVGGVAMPAGGQPQSLAKARGQNWGLPGATNDSVPITAPIRIDCYPDRLILVPEKGLGQPHVVALGPRTEDGVDELISAVWEHMGLWGTAGSGMYWRPILSIHVAPGADSRYTDLRILLDQSGLDVKRNDE